MSSSVSWDIPTNPYRFGFQGIRVSTFSKHLFVMDGVFSGASDFSYLALVTICRVLGF
jgi:hypothetical protein